MGPHEIFRSCLRVSLLPRPFLSLLCYQSSTQSSATEGTEVYMKIQVARNEQGMKFQVFRRAAIRASAAVSSFYVPCGNFVLRETSKQLLRDVRMLAGNEIRTNWTYHSLTGGSLLAQTLWLVQPYAPPPSRRMDDLPEAASSWPHWESHRQPSFLRWHTVYSSR